MIRSRRSRSIGAALLLLVAGVLTQSGGLALADTPTVGALSVSFASGSALNSTDFAVTGGTTGTAHKITTPFTGSCTRYSDNIAGASWITASAADQACGSTTGVNGVTTYTVHFKLPDRATNGSITGSYYTDNYGSVLVNGQQVSAQPTGDVPANYGNPIPGTPTAIDSPASVHAGDNTLQFVVTDVGSVTGLDYAATINYDTLAGPVQNLLATPGNTTAVLSWAPPADLGSKPLSTTFPYVITVGSGSGTSTTQVPPSAVQPCLGNTANVCYNVSGLTNGTDYTFAVQAQTGAGLGDSAATTAKPSADSQAAIVAPNVTQTLSTCKYATVAQPVCDVYTVPSGGGGVFGLTGNVPVAGNFCGGATCNGGGAETVFPPIGYADPKHPIVDTVTFDRSISPRGIFTQVFYQTKTGAPFQLKFCKNPFVANPDPCISTLIVLFNPFNPVVNGDVQVRILLTSGSDALKAHR